MTREGTRCWFGLQVAGLWSGVPEIPEEAGVGGDLSLGRVATHAATWSRNAAERNLLNLLQQRVTQQNAVDVSFSSKDCLHNACDFVDVVLIELDLTDSAYPSQCRSVKMSGRSLCQLPLRGKATSDTSNFDSACLAARPRFCAQSALTTLIEPTGSEGPRANFQKLNDLRGQVCAHRKADLWLQHKQHLLPCLIMPHSIETGTGYNILQPSKNPWAHPPKQHKHQTCCRTSP